MDIFNSKLLDYLKDTLPDFQKSINGAIFTCPKCLKMKANRIGNTSKIFCLACHKSYGDIFDIVKMLEPQYSTNEEIMQYLKDKYNISYLTATDVNKLFEFYKELGFDLVPITGNSKIPCEKDWVNKSHKDINEWIEWYEDGLNFGVKGGVKSGVTTIDVDTKEIPDELKKLLNDTLKADTERGFHYIYQYEEELPTTRIDNLKLDIINNGKQFVVHPSKINGIMRNQLQGKTINKMCPELLSYLKDKVKNITLPITIDKIKEEIDTEKLSKNFSFVEEGNRNHFLISLGGILRKEMNLNQVGIALSVINRVCCKPPYPFKELNTLVKSLDKYVNYSEHDLAVKILNYLKIVGDATGRDVKEVVGENKEKVDKALAYLVREGYVYKKRTSYHVLKKIAWKEEFFDIDKVVDFTVPYFDDIAIFRPGDMILIGGQQKIGKSHIALNIIKQLVEQHKKPYYLNLEAGNRFARIAKQLHMVDTDFYNATYFSPETIELEDNAITIIDWLLPKDYSETDKLFQHFAEQLFKHGGLLFVFAQLRNSGDFFAKDMVAMFPALVARYLYDKNAEGEETPETGYFSVDYIREPRANKKRFQINCKYDFVTKRLIRTDELDMENKEDRLVIGERNIHDLENVTNEFPPSFLQEGEE